MRKVSRSALVPYSAEQMFRLVDDVEAYPQFLPWCSGARIERLEGDIMEATVELTRGGVTKAFTTQNWREPGARIDLALLGGPFRHLDGCWQFADVGDTGSRVSLDIAFEFESRMVDFVFGRFFEDTCNSLVDAFTGRARQVYDSERS